MSCYCAITPRPPCSHCERSYECDECGETRNQDDDGISAIWNFSIGEEMLVCNGCLEYKKDKSCECGKDKHNFANHLLGALSSDILFIYE